MQFSSGRRIGALATTILVMMLAIIMLTFPSASAALLPFHRLPVNHQMVFKPAIASSILTTPGNVAHPKIVLPVNHQMVFKPAIGANPPNIPTIIVHPNIGLSLNHQIFSNPARLHDESGNSNSHISNPIASIVVVNHVTDSVGIQHSISDKDTKDNGNGNGNHNQDNNNNNNDNSHNSLDVQDKSFINGIKITDVDRSNPHLLKVTLKRTDNNNGNIPKYIAVVAVGKDDQTVAGSTTLRSDDISNTLTVNVVLKNKNNQNGHLDESADVIVWVVPAALHDISSNQ